MKRIVVSVTLAFALLTGTASSDDIYVIQSRSVADIYGESIGHRLKERFPDWSVQVMNLRDFDIDRFSQSREVTVNQIQERASTYSNLVLLGHEVSNLDFQGPNIIQLPPLIGTHGIGAATPTVFLSMGELVRQHVPTARSIFYILSDPSAVSQLRLREFRRLIAEDRTVDMAVFNVKRTSELRAALISINSKTRDPGIIVHNIFSLIDEDTFSVVYSDFVDSIITDFNTRHIEMGVLKPNQTLAIGIGAGSAAVADAIQSNITEETPTLLLDTQIGVNLGRISSLGLNSFVIAEGDKISYVGDNVDE